MVQCIQMIKKNSMVINVFHESLSSTQNGNRLELSLQVIIERHASWIFNILEGVTNVVTLVLGHFI